MQNSKIIEIFKSIQGEGPYTGIDQLFVRFFGCNIHCDFCDTPQENYKEYGVQQLKSEVTGFKNFHSISLTGGEPLCQADFIREFLDTTTGRDYKIYLETNGTLPLELAKVIDQVDIVAMDIKLPSATGRQGFWHEHEEFLNIAKSKDVFVKMVVTKSTVEEDIFKAAEIIKRIDSNLFSIFQPNWFDLDHSLLSRMIGFKKFFLENGINNVKILPQAHKCAGIK